MAKLNGTGEWLRWALGLAVVATIATSSYALGQWDNLEARLDRHTERQIEDFKTVAVEIRDLWIQVAEIKASLKLP